MYSGIHQRQADKRSLINEVALAVSISEFWTKVNSLMLSVNPKLGSQSRRLE